MTRDERRVAAQLEGARKAALSRRIAHWLRLAAGAAAAGLVWMGTADTTATATGGGIGCAVVVTAWSCCPKPPRGSPRS